MLAYVGHSDNKTFLVFVVFYETLHQQSSFYSSFGVLTQTCFTTFCNICTGVFHCLVSAAIPYYHTNATPTEINPAQYTKINSMWSVIIAFHDCSIYDAKYVNPYT